MKIAIYGFGILGSILLTIAGVLFTNHRIPSIWVGFFACVSFLLSFTLYWHDDIKSEPVLKEPMFSEDVDNFFFSLGERGLTGGCKKEILEKKHMSNLFVFDNYRPVELYIEKGTLYADVNIYGGQGLPPIKIKKNKLSNKPDDWDFNSNDKAFEIVDNKQNPIYQFFYKSPSHIVINGIFPAPGGYILANENGASGSPDLPDKFNLKRIFKYPSWKYPGEYENEMGLTLQNPDSDKESIEKFRHATEVGSKSAFAFNNWGLALLELERHEEAIEKFRQATELDPKSAIPFINWGNALQSLGNYEEAIEKYRRASELDPNSAFVFNNWGGSLLRLGRNEEAIAKFRQATELEPNSPAAFNNWGLALQGLELHEAAIKKFRQATELDPNYSAALNNWGNALQKLGRYEEAIEKYRCAYKLDPKSDEIFNGWGYVLGKIGRYEEAIEKFRNATVLNPNYVRAFNNWGNALQKLGRYDEAMEKFRRAKELEPKLN
jgi:tetratricopeptide (TPR) repeat protein